MVENNRSHHAYSFRRTGKRSGRLRWSGYGRVDTAKSPVDIAAQFKGQPVTADMVRQILGMASAHLFIEMVPHHGGTGYHLLLPKSVKRPARITEPDDPREDEPEDDDDIPND
jgi:hypothetical protein